MPWPELAASSPESEDTPPSIIKSIETMQSTPSTSDVDHIKRTEDEALRATEARLNDSCNSRRHPTAPKLLPTCSLSDDVSVASCSLDGSPSRWRRPYQPEPIVDQSVILVIGFFIFALAMIWPPLILLFAYVASKLIPYSFRENDDPTTRRTLFAEFCKDDDLPENFRCIPDHIHFERNFILNER